MVRNGHDNRSRHREVGFQVHGIDAEGEAVIRRQLKRRHIVASLSSCRHAWLALSLRFIASLVAELRALGHTVRPMPAAYVKPYVKRQKNDAADAEAICEAVTRANMRFVATKTPEQQSCLMLLAHAICSFASRPR